MGAVANFEKYGIPAAGLCYEDMIPMVSDEAITKFRGVPEVRVLSVPRPTPQLSAEQVAKNVVPELIAALTRPLTEKEKFFGTVSPTKPPRIAFTGTFNEVQEFFIGDQTDRGYYDAPHCKWTDGLPIIPPTEDRVKAFLACTSHDPDEEFEVINREMDVGYAPVPLAFRYNVEKVAVNAVMAGCTPEMMPICLAIAETHPGRHVTTTTSADIGVITGPIAKQLGMPYKRNAFQPGYRPSAVLGRFMVLFRHNIYHFTPDAAMQHPHGNPLNKCGLIFAEYYEDSPWTNLNEEHGFGRDENTYTRFYTKGMCDFGTSMYGAKFSEAYTKDTVLPGSKEIYEPPQEEVLHYMLNLMKASGHPECYILVINQDHAHRLYARGFKTKEDIRQWVWDHCTETFAEYRDREPWGASANYRSRELVFESQGVPPDKVTDDTIMHLPLYGKDHFHIVTAGLGTPLPSFFRGDYCETVSIDKWR